MLSQCWFWRIWRSLLQAINTCRLKTTRVGEHLRIAEEQEASVAATVHVNTFETPDRIIY